MWNKVSFIGTQHLSIDSDKRNVILTNRITTIVFLLNWVLFYLTVREAGLSFLAMAMSIGNVISYSAILLFNHLGYSVVSRIIVSWMVSAFTFVVTLISKFEDTTLDELSYISPRVFILATSILPLLIFNSRQLVYLVVGLAGSFIPIIFYDFIHNLYGIGFYQQGLKSSNYDFIVILFIGCYFIFVLSVVFFKRITEILEVKNQNLIQSLEQKNARILAQTEELKKAYSNVKDSNKDLESQIFERTETILQQTHKFRRFSQLNSHDLRAPLAKVLGLIDHLKSVKSEQERKKLLQMLESASNDLDKIIRKINDILKIEDSDWEMAQKL